MMFYKIWHWNHKNIVSAFLSLQIWISFPCPRLQKRALHRGLPQHKGRETSLSSLWNQGSHIIMSFGIPAVVSELRWCVLTKLHVFLRAQNSHRLCEPEAGPQTTPWDGKNKALALLSWRRIDGLCAKSHIVLLSMMHNTVSWTFCRHKERKRSSFLKAGLD